MQTNTHDENLKVLRGEAALFGSVLFNSLGVVLILRSHAGVSAISSVSYALSEAFPIFTLGTWSYLFQGILVLSLMVLRKKFVPMYLFSFVVGFFFGKMLDFHEIWLCFLPDGAMWRVLYFVLSFFMFSVGIALSNRCQLPVIPNDLFPRELSMITGIEFSKIKVRFDLICVAITVSITLIFLGHLKGLGIGTIATALIIGRTAGAVGNWMDQRVRFVSFLTPHN